MTVGERVYAALSGAPQIMDLVGGRIEPGTLPQNSALPAIVYTVTGGPCTGTLGGDSGVHVATVQIDVFYRTVKEAQLLHRYVREALRDELAATGSVPSEGWDPVDPRFRLTADYQVAHDDHDEEA